MKKFIKILFLLIISVAFYNIKAADVANDSKPREYIGISISNSVNLEMEVTDLDDVTKKSIELRMAKMIVDALGTQDFSRLLKCKLIENLLYALIEKQDCYVQVAEALGKRLDDNDFFSNIMRCFQAKRKDLLLFYYNFNFTNIVSLKEVKKEDLLIDPEVLKNIVFKNCNK